MPNDNSASIVSKVWNYAHVSRTRGAVTTPSHAGPSNPIGDDF